MSDRRYNEKEEEKRHEKEDEKRDEKFRRDHAGALTWALILIWGGLVLLAETTGFKHNFSWWNGWAVFFLGAGSLIFLSSIFRILLPEHRHPIFGNLIFSIILIGIGLGWIIGWTYIWAVVLIGIGLLIILRSLMPRR